MCVALEKPGKFPPKALAISTEFTVIAQIEILLERIKQAQEGLGE